MVCMPQEKLDDVITSKVDTLQIKTKREKERIRSMSYFKEILVDMRIDNEVKDCY